ncbi:MAG: heme lyase CcmF/NrfE family subunit [Phycisphaeraceae bacterium]|nr:heme lyase CcmF/NrfE family subunit [Phycisphaeraceae bacterium]
MTALIGDYSLSFCVLIAGAGIAACLGGLTSLARWCIVTIAVALSVSCGALLTALFQNDFSIAYVAEYSERALPLGYKIAALWAGQPGSLLLWAWFVAVMAVIFVLVHARRDDLETRVALGAVAAFLAFLALLLLYDDHGPFVTQSPAPLDGLGLNPLLQDPAMVAHPPALFLGYAGFTFPFALMLGAMVAGRSDSQWLAALRRWTLASWLFLTIGIILGAQWAYIELGWGGYWAWDPVENASLLPWLTSTALLHSMIAEQQRGALRRWNVALIAANFILCLLGTYLTRSDIVQSVHAFAGSFVATFFLALILLCLGVSGALLIWRWGRLETAQPVQSPWSKEGAFWLGNALLTLMTVTTLVGTLWPAIYSLFGGAAMDGGAMEGGPAVGLNSAFYNRIVLPMGLVLLALMAAGPMLTIAGNGKQLARRMTGPFVGGLAVVAIQLLLGIRGLWPLACGAVVGTALTSVALGFVQAVNLRRGQTGQGALSAAIHVFDGSHRRYGGQIVHLGMLMVMAGIAGSSLFGIKDTFSLEKGQSRTVAGYQIHYLDFRQVKGSNYTALQADLRLEAPDGTTTDLAPQTRYYSKSSQPNTEVALMTNLRRDIYVTLAGWDHDGRLATLEARINPLVAWIWVGGIVLSLGAVIGLMPRFLPARQTQPADARSPSASKSFHIPLSTCDTETP